MASLGRVLIIVGIAVVVFGVLVLLASRIPGTRGAPLPGDIAWRREHITVYFPIVSSIVLSLILTLVVWLISALTRR